jgi:hypothetical protein
MKPKEPELPRWKAGVTIDGIKAHATINEIIKAHRRAKEE